MKQNDYPFGERLYRLRKAARLSQRALGEKLGVTDKAVSKWENGAAKPTTDMLNRLSVLFDVPVSDLLQERKEKRPMTVQKIVITGGPCGGKTTALTWIANNLPQRGYRVLFVPETATELIGGGLTPWGCGTNLDYQRCQMELQLEKERLFERGGRTMDAEKLLIVCDRGTMDNKAYMTDLEFMQLCREMNTSEVELRDRYDAVFHLVTAAKGALNAYTTANNAARYETPEVAVAVDDRIIAAWTGHPHLRIIDNSSAFEEKLERLLNEILSFLGEPEPLEIERKYLIEYPDVKWLESQPNCRKVEISQTYLVSAPGEEVRIRQHRKGPDPEGVSQAPHGRGPHPSHHPQDPLPSDARGPVFRDRSAPLLDGSGPVRDRAVRRARPRGPAAPTEGDPGGHRRSGLPERGAGGGGAGGAGVLRKEKGRGGGRNE